MKVIITKGYEEASREAYEIVKKVVLEKEDAVLGLATGSTPLGLYGNMVEGCQKGEVSYKKVRSMNLDEYIGLGAGDEQSYVEFMKKNLFDHIDIDQKNTDIPCGKAEDMAAECARYDQKHQEIGVDLQVLGIGSNGHIGFNEPGTPFGLGTHPVDLAESTIRDNARFYQSIDEVPKRAVSMGIKTVMHAKKILLIATGANKAQAIKAALEGPVDEKMPASVLQLHPDCTFILDEAAASLLGKA